MRIPQVVVQSSMLVSSTWMIVSRDSLRRETGHQLSSLEQNQDKNQALPLYTVFPRHGFPFFSEAMRNIYPILPKCSLVCSYSTHKQYPNSSKAIPQLTTDPMPEIHGLDPL